MYMLIEACLKEISWNCNHTDIYIFHHENIAYLNWPIDEGESYDNCTEVDLSCDHIYVLGEIGVTVTFGI